MGQEIERKYLVKIEQWQPQGMGEKIRQGYISSVKERIVRVRTKGSQAFLTIKGSTNGISRAEFEYKIPNGDADILLKNLCEQPLVEKTRYIEEYEGHCWEIDVFGGANTGLVIAEVELKSVSESLRIPTWVEKEVSSDSRYFNSNLIKNPYSTWKTK